MTMDNHSALLQELTNSIDSLLSLLEASITSVSDASTITPPSQGWATTTTNAASLGAHRTTTKESLSTSLSSSSSSSSSLSTRSVALMARRPQSVILPSQTSTSYHQHRVQSTEPRIRRGGYEVRRASRRLERAIQCLSVQLESYHNHNPDDSNQKYDSENYNHINDDGDENLQQQQQQQQQQQDQQPPYNQYHRHHRHDENDNSSAFHYFCSTIESSQDDLIRILTVLPRVLEESFRSCNGSGGSTSSSGDGNGLASHQHDIMQLFDQSACAACQILMRYYFSTSSGGENGSTNGNTNHDNEHQRRTVAQETSSIELQEQHPKPLPFHHLSALLDQIATILFKKQSRTRDSSKWLLSSSSTSPQDSDGSGEVLEAQHVLLVSVINQNLALIEQVHPHQDHDEHDSANHNLHGIQHQSPILPRGWAPPPEETMQLIQLLLPHCMNDLSTRWDTPKLHHHPNNDKSEDEDGPVQLRVFAENMLQHLSRSFQQYKEEQHEETIEGDIQQEQQQQVTIHSWLEQAIEAAAESSVHQNVIYKRVTHFMDTCHEYGIEIVEYALDVLDGAKVVLGTLTTAVSQPTSLPVLRENGNSKHDEEEEDRNHHSTLRNTNFMTIEEQGTTLEDRNRLCQLVLSDILKHTAIALSTVMALKEALNIGVPIRSLFVTFANEIASTCHEAFLFLGKTQGMGHEHFQTALNEILVQMGRIVVKDEILQEGEDSPLSGMRSKKTMDVTLENALAIALTKDLELLPPNAEHTSTNHESLTDYISKCLSNNDSGRSFTTTSNDCETTQLLGSRPFKILKTGKPTQSAIPPTKGHCFSPEFLQVMQATTMASFILPHPHDLPLDDGSAVEPSSHFTKRQEMHHSMQYLYEQLTSNSNHTNGSDATTLLDPWQSLLSRKVVEEGLLDNLSIRERSCDN